MKTCPVCHARAFDDAEVCFGCLHRFDETPRPVAAPRPTGRSQPAPCPFPGGKPRAAAPAVGRATPRVGGDVPSTTKRLDGPPLDGAGWIVRFEFPGCASVEEVPSGAAHAFRLEGNAQEGARPRSLVVSLRPDDSTTTSEVQSTAVRGSHVRAALTAAAERS